MFAPSPVGEGRGEGIRPHGDLNLDLRSQLNHAVRRDLELVRRTQGVTLQDKVQLAAQAQLPRAFADDQRLVRHKE